MLLFLPSTLFVCLCKLCMHMIRISIRNVNIKRRRQSTWNITQKCRDIDWAKDDLKWKDDAIQQLCDANSYIIQASLTQIIYVRIYEKEMNVHCKAKWSGRIRISQSKAKSVVRLKDYDMSISVLYSSIQRPLLSVNFTEVLCDQFIFFSFYPFLFVHTFFREIIGLHSPCFLPLSAKCKIEKYRA